MLDSPPEHKSRATAGAVISRLCERFPTTFFRYHRQPLAIGIREEILQVLDDVSEEELAQALATYVNSVLYLRNVQTGAARIDLDGEPAGTVTESEAEFAQRRIVARNNGSGH
jgi:ProP effector